MKQGSGPGIVGLVLGLSIFLSGPTVLPSAADMLPKKGTWSLGVRSGYTTSNRDLDTVPVNFHLGYTVFSGKKWIIPKGAFEVGIEPFASVVTHVGDSKHRSGSVEAGLLLPILTYTFDLGLPVYPYIEGALGVQYQDYKGFDMGGGFNFTEMVGAGLSYAFNHQLSLNVGYRFRHISNASIYDENRGMNTDAFLAGFSYLLPAR